MCLHYNRNRGHNQLFVSEIRDNIFRGFVVIMSNLQHFVERLSELLIDHEMKPANLAKELGVGWKMISRYMNGTRYPDLTMALRMSAYFHCSIDFLLGRSDTGASFVPLPMPPFSERIEYVLSFYGKTKYRVAKDTSISESTLYNWKFNRSAPTLENIIALADYLESSVEFILGREN